jgi:DUF971 family protein
MSEGASTDFTGATLDLEAKELTVRWGDGHTSVYPLAYLRKHCPCAGCRDQRSKMSSGGLLVLSEQALHAGDALENLVAVGRYAMQPVWADGHNTGIFTFEYLRELCPCPECRSGRA